MDALNPEDHQSLEQADESLKRAFKMGYGRWLTPLMGKDDMFGRFNFESEPSSENLEGFSIEPEASSSNQEASPSHQGASSSNRESSSSSTEPEPPRPSARRGRGRPRVNAARDASAIEKRRAQVRNAQRTYQKRKDNATSSVNTRCDDLLEVLSDLSSDVEELLKLSSKCGLMNQDSEVALQLQRLWATYDNVVNRPAVLPELRLLKVKNDRRRAEHCVTAGSRTTHPPPQDEIPGRSEIPVPPFATDAMPPLQSLSFDQPYFTVKDVENVDMNPFINSETCVLRSFLHTSNTAITKMIGDRTIFDIVQERQAQLKASDNEKDALREGR